MRSMFSLSSFLILMLCTPAYADTATFYTVKSVLAEGNSGITASGEKFDETKFTCAMRSRDFGRRYRITNLKNGKSVIVRQNDYGPGKKQAARGVVADLSPAAFDALGGKRGLNWGEIKVKMERIK